MSQPFQATKFDFFFASALSGLCANSQLIYELRKQEPKIDVTKEIVGIALQVAAASIAAEVKPE